LHHYPFVAGAEKYRKMEKRLQFHFRPALKNES